MPERIIYTTPPFPEYVIVETSSRCNLRCVMCDREHAGRPVGDMSMTTYQKIVDEAAKYPGTKLSLQFLGEPLLNKQILPMIQSAKQSGISYVSMTTNGMLLDRKGLTNSLLASGIDEIIISVDGVTKDTFEKIRFGASSDRIEKNIRRLLEIRVGRSPQINLAFCQTRENKDEEELFVQKWGSVVDKITFKAGLDNDRKVIRQDLIDLSRPRVPCMELWDVMVVYNNGDAGICCEDLYNSAIKGNINQSPLHDIWTGSEYEKIRKDQINGNYETLMMCKICEYWRRAEIGSAKNEIYSSFVNPQNN